MNLMQANGSLFDVKRTFKIDSWFNRAVAEFGGEHLCEVYGVEKIIKDHHTYYLVNEVKDVSFEEIKDEI